MNGFVKLCGLTQSSDVRLAVEAGADALGFVFWPKSPRHVTAKQVSAWDIPSDRLKVGVFVDQPIEAVQEIFDTAGLSLVQLHGSEDADYIRRLNRPAWKALHLDRCPENPETLPVEALLMDSGTVEMPGGTGIEVDLARAAAFVAQIPAKVLLAGGLKADTVGRAIHAVRPYGVDVSSGIETAPGIKHPEQLAEFFRQARKAFASLSPQSKPIS